jgi:cytoskeletal protein RodZ
MFEIGSSLRDARLRLGLALEDVARETRISARVLAALEAEEFVRLPGDFYARSYLRTYAEFLSLESGRFLDEYRSRFGEPEQPALARSARTRLPVPGKRVLLIAALVALTAALFLAFGSQRVHREQLATPIPPSAKPLRPKPLRQAVPAQVQAKPTQRRLAATLAVRAGRGNCWLQVRAGSARGPVIYEATLQRGQAVSFSRHFLWIRLGAPASVDVRVHGKLVPGLTTLSPTNLLISPRGASSG